MASHNTPKRVRPPRLSITLSPEARGALERFTEVTGIASAQYITGLVNDAVPIIEATTRALAIAKTQPQKSADILNQEIVRVVGIAAQAKLDLDEARSRKKLRLRPKK
jgi:hypothetical protein